MRMAAQETMELVDANGNTLLYYCENDTSAAFFTGIKSYAQDETQAGRIIIADEVSDSQGNVHEVRYICYSGSISNRSNLVSVIFGNNIICVDGQNGNIYDAFYNCLKLESVTLNAKLETIGPYAFAYCYALKTVNPHCSKSPSN